MPFGQVSSVGAHAVRKAVRVFRAAGYEVEPVEHLHLGHDLIAKKDGAELKIEVKFDTLILQTGNVSAEWWDDQREQRPGWVQTCDADAVVYFYEFDWAYVLDPRVLRDFVSTHLDTLEDGYVRFPDMIKDRATGEKRRKETLNKLVPITLIPHARLRQLEALFGTPEQPVVLGSGPKRARKRDPKQRTVEGSAGSETG